MSLFRVMIVALFAFLLFSSNQCTAWVM